MNDEGPHLDTNLDWRPLLMFNVPFVFDDNSSHTKL